MAKTGKMKTVLFVPGSENPHWKDIAPMKPEHKQIPCRIFDAHCHIYPDAIAHKAVEGIAQFYDHLPFKPYDGTTGTLYRIGREAGISHYLVHSVATAPHQISST